MKKNEIYTAGIAIVIFLIILLLSEDIQSGLYGMGAVTVGLIALYAVITYPLLGILFIILYEPFTSLIEMPYFGSGGRLAGLLAAIGWLLKHFLRGKTAFFSQLKFNVIPLCFILSMLISSALAVNPTISFKFTVVIIMYIVMCFFMQDFIDNKKRLTTIIAVKALSIGVASLVLLIQYIVASGGGETSMQVMYSQSGDVKRIGGNAYAALLMSGIPSLIFLSLNARNVLLKMTCSFFFLASFLALGLTVARTHIFSFIVFVAVYITLGMKNNIFNKQHLLILLTVVSLVTLIFSGVVLDLINQRSATLEDTSSVKRFLVMRKGAELLLEHPLTGIGFHNIMLVRTSDDDKYSYVDDTGGHDLISVVFVATGIPGTLLVLIIFFKTFKYLNIAVKNYSLIRSDRYLLNLSITLKAAYIALLITSFGNDIISSNTFWIYIALSSVLYRLSIQQNAAEKLKHVEMYSPANKVMSTQTNSP